MIVKYRNVVLTHWSLVLCLVFANEVMLLDPASDDNVNSNLSPNSTSDWHYSTYGQECSLYNQSHCTESFESLYCNLEINRCDCMPPRKYDIVYRMCRIVSCYESCTNYNYYCIDEVCTLCYINGVDVCYGGVTPAPDDDEMSVRKFAITIGAVSAVTMLLVFFAICVCKRRKPTRSPTAPVAAPVIATRHVPDVSRAAPTYPPTYPPWQTTAPDVERSVKVSMETDLPPSYYEAIANESKK